MKCEIGGALLLYKPAGITSFDAVAKIRRLYGTRRVGHTGTLDPMAEGLLVVLVGGAVRASDCLLSHGKTYIAEMKLGITTDTADTSGKLLSSCSDIPEKAAVIAAAESFVGKYMQIPPMYSALKVDGKKLYELAREGKTVFREARELYISSLQIDGEGDTYKMKVSCSKGTYIRTLCEDIGKKLGCGAAMSALLRTFCGDFSLDDAYTLDELEKMTEDERRLALIPSETLFHGLDSVLLPDFFAKLCENGCEIYQKKIGTSFPSGQLVKVYSSDGFLGVGCVSDYPDGSAIKLSIRLT